MEGSVWQRPDSPLWELRAESGSCLADQETTETSQSYNRKEMNSVSNHSGY